MPLWFIPKKEKVSFDGVVIFRFPKTYWSLCGLSVKHTVNKMCTKHNRQGSCEKLLMDTAHPQHLLQSFNHHHLSARPWQTTTSSLMDSPWDGTGSSILLAWQRLLHWFQFGTTHLDWQQRKHKRVKMSLIQCIWQSCSSDYSISADKYVCTWSRMAKAARCNGHRIPQRGENSWTPMPLFGRLVEKRS